MITIEIGQEFNEIIVQLAAKLQKIDDSGMKLMASLVKAKILQNFANRQSPAEMGGESAIPWKPLAPSTIKNYSKKGYELVRTLDRGHLLRRSTVVSFEGNQINIQNNVPYARAQSEGFKGTVSVRSHIRKVKSKSTRISKRKGIGKSVGIGYVNAHSSYMNIPATHPFNLTSEQIGEIIQEYESMIKI